MLTLKSPLQLQSITPILSFSDQLSQKIIGNYQLMNLSISAQDLLHMTMQEPEIYVAMGNEQITVIDNQISNQNQEKLEAINQFFNRIMLFSTHAFTYQDEVYVTSILQKMGITDVATFMTQIKQSVEKNELLQKLVNQYFDKGSILKETISEFMENHKESMLQLQDSEHTEKTIQNLQDVVFRHLYTAEAINTVYDYQKVPSEDLMIAREQARLLPQLQTADTIQLQQLRQYILQQNQTATWEQHNVYEEKKFTREEMTKENVIRNLAAAVLTNMVTQETYESITYSKNHPMWIDFTQTFYENSLDTLQRFERNQIENALEVVDTNSYASYMKQLYQNENTLLQVIEQAIEGTREQQEEPQVSFVKNSILTLLENQNLQQQITESIRIYHTQIQNETEQKDLKLEQYVLETLQKQAHLYQQIEQKYQEEISHVWNEKTQVNPSMDVIIENNSQYDDYTKEQNEYLAHVEQKEQNISVQQEQRIEQTQQQILNQEDYIEYLYQTNQKNVAIHKQLQDQEQGMEAPTKKIMIDKKFAREKSLGALENPQKVLQEIYQSAVSIENPLPQKIEKLLLMTDEKTRRIYENILGIKNKESSQEKVTMLETDVNTVKNIVEEVNAEAIPVQDIQKLVRREKESSVQEMLKILHEVVQNQEQIRLQGEQTISHVLQNRIEHSLTVSESKNEQIQEKILERKESQVISPEIIRTEGMEEGQSEQIEQLLYRNTQQQIQNQLSYQITKEQNTKIDSIEDVSWITLPIQQIEKHLASERLPVKQTEEEHTVALVHQHKEQIQEEIIDEVMHKIQEKTRNITKERTVQQTEQIVTKHIQNTKKEILAENEQMIQDILQQSLQSQVHSISNQVYQDIERRLQSERRRRGY